MTVFGDIIPAVTAGSCRGARVTLVGDPAAQSIGSARSIHFGLGTFCSSVVLAASRVVMVLCSIYVCKPEVTGELFGSHITKILPQNHYV